MRPGGAARCGVPGLGAGRRVHQDLGGEERPAADTEDQVHVSLPDTHEESTFLYYNWR